MEEEIITLQDASRVLGINYIAARHMTEFGVVNETAVIEDLETGLLYEWLRFIFDHTDSNTNNFEETIIKLFLKLMGDNMELILLTDERERMMEDNEYVGIMSVMTQESNNYELERIPIRLNYRQYLFFIEILSKQN